MITVFHKRRGSMIPSVIAAQEAVPKDALWIDILNPTIEEEKSVESQLGIEIPTREEVWKNQVLNRLYHEGGVSYMTAAIITKVESPWPQTSSVTFILARECLVTIRYISPTSFSNLANRLMRNPQKFTTGAHMLEGLLEEIITRVAYNSEIVVDELDKLSHDIFGMGNASHRKNPSQMMQEMLKRLSTCADLNSKINESLHSLSRTLNFFRQIKGNDKEMEAAITTLSTDASALTKQTAFLSDKLTFQLDALLGMINVEQNMIIKIFSVVAVCFLPPTLVASVYGMNFEDMPELRWEIGYPLAIGAIAVCAVTPYFYFRRKGWL